MIYVRVSLFLINPKIKLVLVQDDVVWSSLNPLWLVCIAALSWLCQTFHLRYLAYRRLCEIINGERNMGENICTVFKLLR